MICKLVTDQWRASLGVRDGENCWFTEEIGRATSAIFVRRQFSSTGFIDSIQQNKTDMNTSCLSTSLLNLFELDTIFISLYHSSIFVQ